jgi:hypothetical protein
MRQIAAGVSQRFNPGYLGLEDVQDLIEDSSCFFENIQKSQLV